MFSHISNSDEEKRQQKYKKDLNYLFNRNYSFKCQLFICAANFLLVSMYFQLSLTECSFCLFHMGFWKCFFLVAHLDSMCFAFILLRPYQSLVHLYSWTQPKSVFSSTKWLFFFLSLVLMKIYLFNYQVSEKLH